jgi:hypothetical protein
MWFWFVPYERRTSISEKEFKHGGKKWDRQQPYCALLLVIEFPFLQELSSV